jgi:hypothetical protein
MRAREDPGIGVMGASLFVAGYLQGAALRELKHTLTISSVFIVNGGSIRPVSKNLQIT